MNNLIVGLVILSKYSDDCSSYNNGDYICVETFEDISPDDQMVIKNYGWTFCRIAKCWRYSNTHNE